MVATRAIVENDFRLKSIMRCLRLCAPPRPFSVIRPRLFRPLQAVFPNVKFFSLHPLQIVNFVLL